MLFLFRHSQSFAKCRQRLAQSIPRSMIRCMAGQRTGWGFIHGVVSTQWLQPALSPWDSVRMSEGSESPIGREGDVELGIDGACAGLSHDHVRHLLQQGIDSGPGVDADVAFARIRAQLGSAPGA